VTPAPGKVTVRNLIATIRSYCGPDAQCHANCSETADLAIDPHYPRSTDGVWSADGGDLPAPAALAVLVSRKRGPACRYAIGRRSATPESADERAF
jgi:hypothetical protein